MVESVYGEQLLVYGGGQCPECGAIHGPERQIKETMNSRFRLLQFAAEMTAYDVKGTNRKAVDSAFMKARSDAGLSSINKKLRQTEKDVEDVRKLGAIDMNREKLARLQRDYDATDKAATAPLRDPGLSYKGRFPESKEGYSPLTAGAQRSGDTKFMLGILINGLLGDTLITTSGDGFNSEPFRATAALKKMTICGEPKVPHRSIEGRQISDLEYSATRSGQGYEAGKCAAPRLLDFAFTQPRFMYNFHNWQMSEIYYFPNDEARHAQEAEADKARKQHVELAHPGATGDHPQCAQCQSFNAMRVSSLYWVPGLSAHSCETCDRLVPLLMCPKKA